MDEHKDSEQTMKACPRCYEQVKAEAQICKYCHSQIGSAKDGQIVRVRVQAGENIYRGDLHIRRGERMSDAINDARRFLILSKVKKEGKLRDVSTDFLAINKDSINSIRLCEKDEM